jgi:GalNAc-alpha-(1->4)-GalNAc-alpha-(1->3)-diNAcBac-PP-undecaprenol alpha-1,4-N-acetyl-D-galactosaminyltransferase
MEKKYTVALVIPSLHAGGMERVMSELANYFVQKPYLQVHLILYGIKRDVFFSVHPNITIHKPAFTFDNSKRFVHSIKTLLFVRKKIKTLQPHTILSFGEFWNSFVMLALLGLKYPIYLSDRSQPNKPLSFLQNILRNILYPKATGIIAQTNIAKQIYATKYQHHNVKVIGNPIRKIQPNITIKKENIVLSVGRLINTKHHDELIKLFVSINKPNWKLVIVGDDAIKQNNLTKLKALVATLKANDKVILVGSSNNVDEYYLKSKIFAFTSSSEGFPNVLAEAQAAGITSIAFDCIAGPADIITDQVDGFLIPLFNYQLFQQKLALLMDDEQLCATMSNAAKNNNNKFYVNDIAAAYEKFITEKIA